MLLVDQVDPESVEITEVVFELLIIKNVLFPYNILDHNWVDGIVCSDQEVPLKVAIWLVCDAQAINLLLP